MFSHLVALSLALCSIPGHVVSATYCTPGQSRPGDPALPKMDYPAFVVDYQVTVLDVYDKKLPYTMWAQETYDYSLNMMKMLMLNASIEEGVIMDYASNAFIQWGYINKANNTYECQVLPLDQAKDDLDVFGGLGKNSNSHIVAASDVFKFGKNLGEAYIERTKVDGVPANHWRSCLYWDDDKDNFTVDYYFTLPGWHPDQIPLRMEMTGVKQLNGQQVQLHHIYEFANFQIYGRVPAKMFSPPASMQCIDVHKLRQKAMPVLDTMLFYTEEIVVKNEVRVAEIMYDYAQLIVREKERFVVKLDDFSSGVRYIIDTLANTCDAGPLQPSFDTRPDTQGMIRLATPRELFFLEKDFEYRGLDDVDGIPTDAWTRSATINGGQTQYDVYFMRGEWNSTSFLGDRPLITVVETSKTQPPSTIRYNIFGYSPYPALPTNPLDISLCRTEKQTKNFRVTFEGSSLSTIMRRIGNQNIQVALLSSLRTAAGASVLQMSWTDLVMSTAYNKLYWTGKLFEPEPTATRATNVKNAKPPVSLGAAWDLLQSNILKGSVIAEFFMPYKLTATATQLQDLDIDFQNIGKDSSPLSKFNKYPNVKANDIAEIITLPSVSVEDCATYCLTSTIECTGFMVTKESCTLGSRVGYPKTSFAAVNGMDLYVRDYTAYFKRSGGLYQASIQDGYTKVADISHCAQLCVLKTTGIPCSAFDFCPSSSGSDNVCLLHSSHSHSNDDNASGTAKNCKHFHKEHLMDYKAQASQTLVSASSKFVKMTSDAKTCASRCSETKGCNKFSFCEQTNQCLLVTSAVKDVSMASSKGCTVFTSKSSTPVDSSALAGLPYKPGDMAGVGVAMLIISVLATVGVFFLVAKRGAWNGFGLPV